MRLFFLIVGTVSEALGSTPYAIRVPRTSAPNAAIQVAARCSGAKGNHLVDLREGRLSKWKYLAGSPFFEFSYVETSTAEAPASAYGALGAVLASEVRQHTNGALSVLTVAPSASGEAFLIRTTGTGLLPDRCSYTNGGAPVDLSLGEIWDYCTRKYVPDSGTHPVAPEYYFRGYTRIHPNETLSLTEYLQRFSTSRDVVWSYECGFHAENAAEEYCTFGVASAEAQRKLGEQHLNRDQALSGATPSCSLYP